MSDPSMVSAIKNAVTIPVMAKCRIGHFVEAQVLEALAIDYVDESEARFCHNHTEQHTNIAVQPLTPFSHSFLAIVS